MTVRRGEAALREVLACVDPARLPGEPLVTVRGLDAGDRVERSEIAGAGGRLCYRFASRPVPLGPELAAAAERAAAENPPQSLHATFPGGPRGVPFTFLSCDTTPDGLESNRVTTRAVGQECRHAISNGGDSRGMVGDFEGEPPYEYESDKDWSW